jgi:hypothetical protein
MYPTKAESTTTKRPAVDKRLAIIGSVTLSTD